MLDRLTWYFSDMNSGRPGACRLADVRLVTRRRIRVDAGAKAPDDVRAVCAGLGIRNHDVTADGMSLRSVWALGAGMLNLIGRLALRPNRVVVVQYPLGRGLELLPNFLSSPVVAFVHDLESLRKSASHQREYANLDRYDAVIVHSDAMADMVQSALPNKLIIVLGCFDYLTDDLHERSPSTQRPDRLYVVGNLHPDKAGYLYRLEPTKVPVNAFGPNCETGSLPSSVSWGGTLLPDRPTLPAANGFGLVWDGDSPHELRGATGRYLRYNMPHKLSLYLAAGIPVIVPQETASAEFVQLHGVGYAVRSVYEAAQRVNDCTPEGWLHLRKGVTRIRDEVVSGRHTINAVGAAVEALHGVSDGVVRCPQAARR